MSGSLQFPLQVTLRNVPQSPALAEEIQRRAAKLATFNGRLTGCRVTVERTSTHHRQGQEYHVRLDVHAPGHPELVVDRGHGEDLAVAVRDAFDAMDRRLDELARKPRGSQGGIALV
ncbi:MAG: HPF/RaiA family ribosome-associated protein [Burkholderiales bacterium]